MKEQLFCSKCGKTNWSNYFKTCECKEPNFIFETYNEYELSKKKEAPTD